MNHTCVCLGYEPGLQSKRPATSSIHASENLLRYVWKECVQVWPYFFCIVLWRYQYLRIYRADGRVSGEWYDSGWLQQQDIVVWSESHSNIIWGKRKQSQKTFCQVSLCPSRIKRHQALVLLSFVLRLFALTPLANLRQFLICAALFSV